MRADKKEGVLSAIGRWLWDLWCCVSVVGIWPRFIEPKLIASNVLHLQVPQLPSDLEYFRILQFSDLHLHKGVSDAFLKRLLKKIKKSQPQIILFTGDFLCNAALCDPKRLKQFLCSLEAPYGCYAVLGNHDFAKAVSVDPDTGDYDVISDDAPAAKRIWQRFFRPVSLTKKISERARNTPHHSALMALLAETPFSVLENETRVIPIGNTFLNICGLGEYTLGRMDPEKAFTGWDPHYPGVVMAHNPDSVAYLDSHPAALVLCGHTHGCQVNLPWLWKRFTLQENPTLRRGLVRWKEQWVYINSGVGSLIPFRWFAVPEVLLIVLERPEAEEVVEKEEKEEEEPEVLVLT